MYIMNNDLDNLVAGNVPEQEVVQDTPEVENQNQTGEGGNTPNHQSQDNSVIRSMREAISQKDQMIKEANERLEKVAKANGMTVDEYLKKLDEEDLNERAKKSSISPELQRQLDEQNRRLSMYEEERTRARFNRNVDQLMKEHNLSEEETTEFLRGLSKRGIDPINTDLTHSELYFAVNGPNIINGLKEQIRQEVIQEMNQKGSRAPLQNPGGTAGDETKGNLDDLLSDMFGK